MSQEPGGKLKYHSSYAATRPQTAAQHLAELACERQAARVGQQLVARFWNTDAWRAAYNTQLRHANALVKVYDPQAIMKAFREQKHVYSLGAGFFNEHLARTQKALDKQREQVDKAPAIEATDTTQAPRRGVSPGKSAKSKLRDL